MTASEVLYILQAKDAEHIKIGITCDIRSRIRSLSENIVVEQSCYMECLYSARRIEQFLHLWLDAYRVSKPPGDGYTEWFKSACRDELEDFLEECRDRRLLSERRPLREKLIAAKKDKPRPIKRSFETMIWTCDVCGKPIDPKAGYLTVSYVEMAAYEKALQEWKDEHSGDTDTFDTYTAAELFKMPRPAKWKALHRGCDPEPDSNDYWAPLDECQTEGDLLDWTLHLLGKNWFQATDWPEMVRKNMNRTC